MLGFKIISVACLALIAVHAHEEEPSDAEIMLWMNCGHKGVLEDCATALARGAEINKLDETGANALHYAVFHNHDEVVKLLAKNGADMDAMAAGNELTALDLAAFHGYPKCAKALIDGGASPNIFNKDGFSPAFRTMLGKSPEHLEVLEYLLKEGGVPHDTKMYTTLTLHDVAKTYEKNNEGYVALMNELGIKQAQTLDLEALADFLSTGGESTEHDSEAAVIEEALGVSINDLVREIQKGDTNREEMTKKLYQQLAKVDPAAIKAAVEMVEKGEYPVVDEEESDGTEEL